MSESVTNVINTDKLNVLRKRIEKLPENTHNDIFTIFKKFDVIYNENSNGIFINLSNIKMDCYTDVDKYVNWLEQQMEMLKIDEDKKEEYKNYLK
jgi:signal-transduction protein with cAMP-binding, CBS, and nucleotidyltransferase domain